MTQIPFPAPKYVADSDTSKAAARSVSGDTGRMRATVLAHLVGLGTAGATCDEIEAATEMRHQTASARVKELRDAGLIVATGQRRATRSGRKAVVYIAAACAP